jgi:long-subunit acyl-CoA synthetase (AMP-forming)
MIPYTWGRVLSESLRVASYLASLGLPTGSRIGILSKNCAHWIIVDYAIWLAGHVSVPLYPTLTGEAIHQVLQHAGAEVLFVGKVDDWSRQYDGVPPALTCIAMPLFKPSVSVESKMVDWQEILESNQPLADIPETHADQLATIIYTSGTTGVPKGVMHTFGGLAAAAGQASMIYQVSAQDRVLSYLPLSHVAERLVVELASLYEGYAVYFVESLETFARDLKQARPTIFFAVPRIWVKFQSGVSEQLPPKLFDALIRLPVLSLVLKQVILKKLGLHKVRLCLSGAAPLAASLLEWYKKLGLEILEVYGMTENMGYSHSTRAGDQHVGYVGLPNPGVMVKLSDVGEVLVRSVTNMVGYYRAPDETQKVITEDGFLCTGDLGELDRAGRLKITGRIKELFKTSKGKYVAPAPLENLLAAKREAEQVCVLGADLPQPLALITLSGEAKRRLDSDAVGLKRSFSLFLESVNEKVERHERLSHLVLLKDDWDVGSGLVTPSLKIKRHALEKHYADQVDRWSTAKEPIVLGDF